MLRILITLVFVVICAQSLHAAENEPLVVTAEEMLQWDREGKTYTARGSAVATQGEASLRGEVLIARYGAGVQGRGSKIERIDARGQVLFSDQGSSVSGETGFYDIASGFAELRGGNLRLVSGSDVVTARERMTYNALKSEMRAYGNAMAVRGEDRIKADILVARFSKDPQGKMKMQEVEALGNVVITTPKERITSDNAIYEVRKNIATVIGNVTIRQGDNELTGAKGQVDLNRNVSMLFAHEGGHIQNTENGVSASGGRVKGVFYPK